ncbi:MAG TPA: hypothetical protein VIA06_16730 [Candidatus Dormibacteraeota bacterium]|jgi:hypothetical protein|nr:hypothetical protein [Candidatus Dormibacteraeota bacterium]
MALKGGAALAWWWRPGAGRAAAVDAWHIGEHIPERMRIAGFIRGRRYTAWEGGGAGFMLYEARSLDVFHGDAYLARLNDPTPLTRRMLPSLLDARRAALEVGTSLGRGIGGCMLTHTLEPDAHRADDLRRRLACGLLPLAVARPGISGAHLLVPGPDEAGAETEEGRLRRGADRAGEWAVLLEGADRAALRPLAGELMEEVQRWGARTIASDMYRLLYELEADEV